MATWFERFIGKSVPRSFDVNIGGDAAAVCRSDQTVLTSFDDAGIQWPSGCRIGECGTCKARLVEGSVRLSSNSHCLTRNDIDAGWTLPCIASPCSNLTLERPAIPMSARSRYEVERTLMLAPEVLELILKPKPGTVGLTRYSPGQHARLAHATAGSRVYSMATPPSVDGTLEFHVRRLPQGSFSTFLCDQLKVGDQLQVAGPNGSFGWQNTPRPSILVAGGTGFAPIKAMLLQWQAKAVPDREVWLYWGGRKAADLYAIAFARALVAHAPGRFHFVPVVSDPSRSDGWTGRTGNVHEAVLDDFASLRDYDVYACGAPALVEAARGTFPARLGLNADRFYADVFAPSLAADRIL